MVVRVIQIARLLIILASRHRSLVFREPGAAPAVGCLPSHLPEADRSLGPDRLFLGRPPTGLAGLEVAPW